MKRIVHALMFLIACCCVGAAAPATAQQQQQQQQQRQQAASLSGQIRLDNNGVPPRLTVRLYPRRESGRPPAVTYTDGQGRYRFVNLSAGQHLLEVHQGERMSYQRVIDLRAGQQVHNITLAVRRAAR